MTPVEDTLPIELADRLRRRMAQAGPPVTTLFVKLANTEVIEVVALAGFDAVIVDFEHSQLSEWEVRRLVTHAAAIGLPAIVRVPEVDRGTVNRLLEAGACGIQLSMTTRREQVDALLSLTRYAPHGTRSINLGHAGAGYGRTPLPRYLERVATGPLVIPQIETAATQTPLPELLDGVDVAFCGTTDLSVDLGVPGDLLHTSVTNRIREVADAAAGLPTPVPLGLFVTGAPGAAMAAELGARYVAVGSDLAALTGALQRTQAELQQQT